MIEATEWAGMPEFIQEKKVEFKKIKVTFADGSYIFVRFNSQSDYEKYRFRKLKLNFCDVTAQRKLFSDVTDQKITDKTKSIWFPFKSHWGLEKKAWVSTEKAAPRYPVYIVSKGRADNGLTTKALNKMGVYHYIVVEVHEAAEYKEKTNAEILVLPSSYLNNYDTCDDLGFTKSKGPGAARNFCIDHSKQNGFKRHWVMDDNLDAFHRLNNNEKYEVETGSTLIASEDFVDRYANVPVAGLNYYSFCKKTDKVPAFTTNTRIYSCLLIENASGYRWRGRYNEDTDLSLRVLKDGLCTIQFNAFLCGKVTTQRMKGGNTKEFYGAEGTFPKSQMLADLHPDVAEVVWKFNRWHHKVNYRPYKNNLLIKESKTHKKSIFNYNMKLESIEDRDS
tara:strand:+ start:33 stop:1208 length:1176 start_codon:yes stop_codon:yes gene_type:complete